MNLFNPNVITVGACLQAIVRPHRAPARSYL